MDRKPTAAFVLTLLAGLWMLGTSGMMYGMGPGFVNGMGGMWGNGMMHGLMRTLGPVVWYPWLGPAAGAVLLVGAVILYSQPGRAHTWGVVILIVSLLNLFVGMGGLLAGALGMVGGALAMSWETHPAG